MNTQTAIELAGSAAALAEIFNITQSAVSQWGIDLPDARVWQLRVMKPEWFTQKPPAAPATPAQAATKTIAGA
jgi:hypothetical protein